MQEATHVSQMVPSFLIIVNVIIKKVDFFSKSLHSHVKDTARGDWTHISIKMYGTRRCTPTHTNTHTHTHMREREGRREGERRGQREDRERTERGQREDRERTERGQREDRERTERGQREDRERTERGQREDRERRASAHVNKPFQSNNIIRCIF